MSAYARNVVERRKMLRRYTAVVVSSSILFWEKIEEKERDGGDAAPDVTGTDTPDTTKERMQER